MARLRIAQKTVDVHLRGQIWDACDLLAGVSRASLRSFCPGPWGKGNEELAREMCRRCATAACGTQCEITARRGLGGKPGAPHMSGCTVCKFSGWQYTDDDHVQTLEGCGPNDVWNDADAVLYNHKKVGRGASDPILGDCDDLAQISVAVGLYSAWKAAGSPISGGRPVDPPGVDVRMVIGRPDTIVNGKPNTMAHAYMASNLPMPADEPTIEIVAPRDGKRLFVFDPAARWGMARPGNDFYGSGDLAVYPVRFADL